MSVIKDECNDQVGKPRDAPPEAVHKSNLDTQNIP